MKTNDLKETKAITLIALVVTIVVLLILAGVSIAVLTGENGIINRASEAKTASAIARVEELANLELTDSIIGVLGKNETEKTVAQILTILKKRGDIEGSGLRSEVSITGFNFGESNIVSVSTTEETKTKNLTANFISPEIEGAYYVLIEGKKYPISKINGRIKIDKTEIQSNDNTSAKISNVVSNDTDIATVEKTGDKQITITGKARGNTTITVQSTGLPDVTLNVNVKGSTALTINTDNTANCSVSPTSVTALEGEEVTLTATPASGKKLKGWYINNELKSTDNPYKYKIPDGTNGTTYATSITIIAQFEEIVSFNDYGKKITWEGKTNEDGTWRLFYTDERNAYLIRNRVSEPRLNALEGFDTSEISDIGKSLNSKYTAWNNKSLTDYSNSEKGCAALLDSKKWTTYSNIVPNAEWAIGSPTVEMFVKSYNLTHSYGGDLGCRVKSGDIGYGIALSWNNSNVDELEDSSFAQIESTLSYGMTIDKAIYCPEEEVYEGAWWLASPSSDGPNVLVFVSSRDRRGFLGGDANQAYGYYSNPIAHRPLVSVPIDAIGVTLILGEI